MINANASTLRHRIAASVVGGMFVVVALISGGVAGSNFNHGEALAETAVVAAAPGLCVVGCGLVSGSGSVGASIDR